MIGFKIPKLKEVLVKLDGKPLDCPLCLDHVGFSSKLEEYACGNCGGGMNAGLIVIEHHPYIETEVHFYVGSKAYTGKVRKIVIKKESTLVQVQVDNEHKRFHVEDLFANALTLKLIGNPKTVDGPLQEMMQSLADPDCQRCRCTPCECPRMA